MELIAALQELEAAAAAVGCLLQDADEETVQLVVDAWGPLMPRGYQARRWHPFWVAWLRDCAERLPCANRAGATDTPENGADWTTDWPSPSCDDVVHPAVGDAQNLDSAVRETQLRQPNWHAQGHQ